jgi:hypothetical protein
MDAAVVPSQVSAYGESADPGGIIGTRTRSTDLDSRFRGNGRKPSRQCRERGRNG